MAKPKKFGDLHCYCARPRCAAEIWEHEAFVHLGQDIYYHLKCWFSAGQPKPIGYVAGKPIDRVELPPVEAAPVSRETQGSLTQVPYDPAEDPDDGMPF